MNSSRSDSPWQDRVPEQLIEALGRLGFVEFTEEWRELSAHDQLDVARGWLREALGLERWRA